MAISNISSPLQSYQKNSVDENKPMADKVNTLPNGDKEVYGVKLNTETRQVAMQDSIVSHLFSNSSTVESDSLRLTFQSAITKLNEILAPQLGENSISQELLDEKGIEHWSPENTANRITSGASAFLAGFQKIHPELSSEALMDKFDEVVGGGLKKGFVEAAGILEELKVFDGTVKENFDKTVSLVEQGMLAHRNDYLAASNVAEDESKDKSEDKTDEELV